MKSKYLNETFDGWKVVDMVKTRGNHKSFVLVKKAAGDLKVVTLRDNALTAMHKGLRTINQFIAGKRYQLDKRIRVLQNSVKSI